MKQRNVIAYGCGSHGLNNFAADLGKLGSIPAILELANRIAKYFRNNRIAKSHLRNQSKETLGQEYQILTGAPTRWLYTLRLLESLIRVEKPLKQVAVEADSLVPPLDEFFTKAPGEQSRRKKSRTARSNTGLVGAAYNADTTEGIRKSDKLHMQFDSLSLEKLLLDKDGLKVWNRFKTLIKLLQPVAFAVHVLQTDSLPISMLAGCFVFLHHWLEGFSEKPEAVELLGLKPNDFEANGIVRTLLRKRWMELSSNSKTLSTTEEDASWLLQLSLLFDPCTFGIASTAFAKGTVLGKELSVQSAVYKGIKMLSERKLIQGTEEDLVQKIGPHIMRTIHTDKDRWKTESFLRMRPIVSWPMLNYQMCDIVRILDGLSCTAAPGERTFSVSGRISTPTRNRLLSENIIMTTKVSFNSKQLHASTNGAQQQQISDRPKGVIEALHSGDVSQFSLLRRDASAGVGAGVGAVEDDVVLESDFELSDVESTSSSIEGKNDECLQQESRTQEVVEHNQDSFQVGIDAQSEPKNYRRTRGVRTNYSCGNRCNNPGKPTHSCRGCKVAVHNLCCQELVRGRMSTEEEEEGYFICKNCFEPSNKRAKYS